MHKWKTNKKSTYLQRINLNTHKIFAWVYFCCCLYVCVFFEHMCFCFLFVIYMYTVFLCMCVCHVCVCVVVLACVHVCVCVRIGLCMCVCLWGFRLRDCFFCVRAWLWMCAIVRMCVWFISTTDLDLKIVIFMSTVNLRTMWVKKALVQTWSPCSSKK